MAKRKPVRSYFEPWVATKSAAHGGLPNVEGIPADAARAIVDAWYRNDKNAPWVVWGSQMLDPCVVRGFMSGEHVVMDDRAIIAVRRGPRPEGTPDHESVAKRICECVNACRGIGDPDEFVKDVRALLLHQISGEADDPREDSRVISLLARSIPPDELEKLGHDTQ
jgi:hypothetical protein